MGSGYGSYAGSPCMSPVGMDQHQNQGMMMGFQQGQQQLNQQPPPFPFAGGPVQGATMSTMPQQQGGGMQGMENQFFSSVPVSQGLMQGSMPAGMPGTPMMQQQDNHMQMPGGGFSGPGGFGGSPTSYAVGGSNAWQYQPVDHQQSPFPMPLSPPHDLAQSCAPSQPNQAFFQQMPPLPDGNGQSANNGANPFCL